jgi:DNA-binding NarL/FixJ family response regulator
VEDPKEFSCSGALFGAIRDAFDMNLHSKTMLPTIAAIKKEEIWDGVERRSGRDRRRSSPGRQLFGPANFLVVVICSRTLIKDCLVKCLADKVGENAVMAFSSVKEWQDSEIDRKKPNIILLYSGKNMVIDKKADGEYAELSRITDLPPVILLSDSENPNEIIDALDLGVKGFIPTSVKLDVAIEAMQLVRAGGVFVPASSLLSARRSFESSAGNRKSRTNGVFTERQEAVVEALRQGKANKIIAYELKMQESTVKVHVRNIMKKLNATNRTEVAYLTRNMFRDD